MKTKIQFNNAIELTYNYIFFQIYAAIDLQKPCTGEKFVRHSSSAIDVVMMFCQLRDFWRYLQWPKQHSVHFLSQLLDCVCSSALLYADIIFKQLQESGFFERIGPFQTADDMCIAANNLEYVSKFISLLGSYILHPLFSYSLNFYKIN